MPAAKKPRKSPGVPGGVDRRAPPDAPAGTLKRLKGALGRPMKIERQGVDLKLVLVERRRAPAAGAAPGIEQMCDELSTRLLAIGPEHAATVLRPLVTVHDALERKGWSGVASLPAPVLAKALALAGMMAREEPSPNLDAFIEGLLPLQAAARARDDKRAPRRGVEVAEAAEISESTFADFDDAQRGWVGTEPAALMHAPERDTER